MNKNEPSIKHGLIDNDLNISLVCVPVCVHVCVCVGWGLQYGEARSQPQEPSLWYYLPALFSEMVTYLLAWI